MPAPYFDALAGTTMPIAGLQTASMNGPGGGVSSPRGNPLALPPPSPDPMPAGGPAMDAGVADPNAPGAVPPPPALEGGAPPQVPGDQGQPSPAAAPQPQVQQYQTITQSDGTLLLHVVNGDGSLGPVVDVLKAPKSPGANIQQQKPPGK